MQLPLLNQDSSIQRFASAAQAKSYAVLDFTVGSVWRALSEALAAVVLWLQYLIILVLGTTRAATSNGPDLDTWMADWSVTRLPAVAATGAVTLSRNTSNLAALVPPGAQIKTTDATQIFTVTTDTTNPSWSTSAGAAPGYFIPAGTASATVPVQAATPGASGNIQAGTLTLATTGISGIDYASNAIAFTNGVDAESDPALRTRFQIYIIGLREGTTAAIVSAARGVQQGLRVLLEPNVPQIGFYTLFVDDGSGNAPDSLIAAVTTAVQAVSSADVTPVVMRPPATAAAIIASLAYTPMAMQPDVIGNVSTALAAFVAALPLGAALPYLQLPAIIFAADPGVAKINSLSVNGAQSDLPAVVGGLFQATISVG